MKYCLLKRITSLVLVVPLCLIAPGCTEKKRYEASFLQLFDTLTTIVSVQYNKAEFSDLAKLIHDELKTYNDLYDIYHDYEGINNIKTINDNAGKQPVRVDSKIIELLKYARGMYELTGGQCNVAMGSVLRIWHDYREAGVEDPDAADLPPMEALKSAALHTDINKMVIDEAASTVYLSDPQMSLDVGAIAKGYATERVCQDLQSRGYQSILLSVGGNVRAVGFKQKEVPWSVAVRNPDPSSPQGELLTTAVHDMSVVTSGIYERYYTVGGQNYHHIIDPKTLMPSAYYQSVTILCNDSGLADGLSTAVFNMSLEEGMAFVKSLEGVEVLWVLPDGSIRETPGFPDYVRSSK